MVPYSIDYSALKEEIQKRGYEKLLLQFPEGMKIYATEIANKFREFEVYISTKPTYGACDIVLHPDKLTLQFGHSEIPNIEYPPNILFVESFSSASFANVASKFAKMAKCESVGIVASVQHVRAIDEVRKILKSAGFEVYVGDGDGRIKYRGQVLGCNFSAARSVDIDVDCFAFLGTGVFHAVGVRIATGKRTYVLDPFSNTVSDVEQEADRLVRQRYGAIAMAENAEKFGIIISEKIGQRRERLALAIKEMIENAGLTSYLFYGDELKPEDFYYDVDAYVNTACPRVTYDDYLRFKKPVLTPIELQIALKLRLWEHFSFDEIVEVD